MRHLFLFLWLFMAGLPFLSAQPLNISLRDAVTIALKKNRELEVARLEKERSDELVSQAWSEALPTVTATARYIRNIELPVTYFPSFQPIIVGGQFQGFQFGSTVPITIGLDNSVTTTLSISQTLFKGSVYAGIRATRIADELSEELFIGAKAKTISEVKKAYYDVLIANEQKRLIEQSISRGMDAHKDSRLLFQQGLAADIDTLRTFLAVENLRPNLIKAESSVEIAKTILITKMGVNKTEQVVLTDSLSYMDDDQLLSFQEAYETAISQRPEVKQLSLQVKAGDEYVSAAFSDFLPTLTAFGQVQLQSQFSDKDKLGDTRWPRSTYVGLELSLPIFSGFKTTSKVQQAEIEKMQVQTQLENTKEVIRSEIKVSLTNVAEAKKRIDVQRRTVQTAERSYAITRSRRAQGIGSQLELTDSELQLNQAKTNYLQAVYDYLAARVDLEKALGRIGRIDYHEE
ncbi:MAG: TolC family protein [Chlorobiales bacterium]|nr:TolC family protein [Chlorobiales bacterium]